MGITRAGFDRLIACAQLVADEEGVEFYLSVPGVGGQPIKPAPLAEYVTIRSDYLLAMERLTDELTMVAEQWERYARTDGAPPERFTQEIRRLLRPVTTIIKGGTVPEREIAEIMGGRPPELYDRLEDA